jgi:hypothetical protein
MSGLQYKDGNSAIRALVRHESGEWYTYLSGIHDSVTYKNGVMGHDYDTQHAYFKSVQDKHGHVYVLMTCRFSDSSHRSCVITEFYCLEPDDVKDVTFIICPTIHIDNNGGNDELQTEIHSYVNKIETLMKKGKASKRINGYAYAYGVIKHAEKYIKMRGGFDKVKKVLRGCDADEQALSKLKEYIDHKQLYAFQAVKKDKKMLQSKYNHGQILEQNYAVIYKNSNLVEDIVFTDGNPYTRMAVYCINELYIADYLTYITDDTIFSKILDVKFADMKKGIHLNIDQKFSVTMDNHSCKHLWQQHGYARIDGECVYVTQEYIIHKADFKRVLQKAKKLYGELEQMHDYDDDCSRTSNGESFDDQNIPLYSLPKVGCDVMMTDAQIEEYGTSMDVNVYFDHGKILESNIEISKYTYDNIFLHYQDAIKLLETI